MGGGLAFPLHVFLSIGSVISALRPFSYLKNILMNNFSQEYVNSIVIWLVNAPRVIHPLH